jgi:hypothetical protein
VAVKVEAPLLLLCGVAAALTAATLSVDLPSRTGGRFWSDGATYHAMARSLAEDFDLRYEVKDLLREQREFERGPGGILLKRGSGGLTLASRFPFMRRVRPEEGVLYYAKSFFYPLVAAPFVRFLGTRGLLLTNALSLAVALLLGYSELRRKTGGWAALFAVLALFLATVTPIYLLWLTPELLNLAVVTGALVAWRRDRPLLSAVLLGLAVYSKPTNAILALPLGLEPLLDGRRGWPSRLWESSRRAAVLAGTALVFFGINVAITGEWNYQGGERKTFEGCFPYASAEATFEHCGEWMTTEHLGPLVGREGEGDRSGQPLSRAEVRASFLWNLVYFWIGRFGGALPYDAPALLALVLFLIWDRTRPGWLALATLLLSAVAYIFIIPANWYGGGAALGNRYFTNLLPLALLWIPPGRERIFAPLGFALGFAFVGVLLLSPLDHSLDPGIHATRAPFLALPLELTELNDLSIFMERWRAKRPYGDTEGDPVRRWPADPKAYYLYFPDNGTRGKESLEGKEGFWVKGGQKAEIVLRALEPPTGIHLRVIGGPRGDHLTISWSEGERTLALREGEEAQTLLQAAPGLPYYGTFVQTLHFQSEGDPQVPGTFVEMSLDVARRRGRPPAS